MFNNELFLLRFGKYMKQLLSIKEKALKIVKSLRGSTAAGINISLLPRDAAARNLPVVLYGEETFFLAFVRNLSVELYWKRPLFPGICGEFADGAILEEASSPGICGFPVALSGERLLFPSICEEFVGGAILEEASFPCICWISGGAILEEDSFFWCLLDFR